MKPLRIFIADDHDLIRQGLRALIERETHWKVCGEADSGPKAVEEASRLSPDIVVVDLMLPGFDGLEVTRRVKRLLPSCEMLVLTGSPESDDLIRKVFASGAKSFILKTEASQFLVDALKSLAEHRPFFTDKASAVIFARFNRTGKENAKDKPAGDERLSLEEMNLVRFLADGHSNMSVAKRKKLSVRTVEKMRAGIMHKLGLNSVADLVRYAARNGIIEV